MDRCKKCVIKSKERKRERGEKEKKRREKSEMKSPKKVLSQVFPLRIRQFLGPIRNTLFRKRQFRSIFVFLEDIIDE